MTNSTDILSAGEKQKMLNANLLIDGHKVQINFLTSDSSSGLDNARKMLKQSLLSRGLPNIKA